jgi:hypothetical protein
VKDEAVAVRREHERHIEHLGVPEPLLHAIADAVVVVLRLDDRERHVGVGLEVEDVVGELRLPARDELPANDDAPGREVNVLTHLRMHVPPGLGKRWRDVLRADVALGELLLVHETFESTTKRQPGCSPL